MTMVRAESWSTEAPAAKWSSLRVFLTKKAESSLLSRKKLMLTRLHFKCRRSRARAEEFVVPSGTPVNCAHGMHHGFTLFLGRLLEWRNPHSPVKSAFGNWRWRLHNALCVDGGQLDSVQIVGYSQVGSRPLRDDSWLVGDCIPRNVPSRSLLPDQPTIQVACKRATRSLETRFRP